MLLIEQNTSYALKIKNTINLSFDKIRSIAVRYCNDLSQQKRDELYEKLRRGVDIIDSEELMYVYLYSYGQMHQAKLNHAFQKLPNDFLKQKEVNIIDYGCGQAFGIICYADFLKSKGINQNIKHITLIEPSVMCLKRAALHSSCIFKTAEIHTINKEFDLLTKEDLYIDEHIPTLHILSNVLDMQRFNLEDFAEVVRTSLKGYNFFICVGPYFGIYDKDFRMKNFASYLNGKNIKSEQLSKNMLIPDKDWTCQTYCFNVGEYHKDIEKSSCKYKVIPHYEGGKYVYRVEKVDKSSLVIKDTVATDTQLRLTNNKQPSGVNKEERNCSSSVGIGNAYMSLYENNGNNKELAEAIKWYKIAVNQGNSEAQKNLGDCYFLGKGVEKDYEKAADLYLDAFNNNNYKAKDRLGTCCYLLGEHYYKGQHVKKDYYKAVIWYQKAAEKGVSKCQWKLGYCYYKGHGVEKDYEEAIKWFKKAIFWKTSKHIFFLCHIYIVLSIILQKYSQWRKKDNQTSNNCNEGNYTEKFEQYKQGAKQGVSKCQWELGDCYYYGYGIEKNYVEAIKWYEAAAKQGNSEGQWKLGMCYENGRGIGKYYNYAVIWYKKSAEQGNSEGQLRLGLCYEKGLGVKKNYIEAIKWYKKAAKNGNSKAQNQLGDCYFQGKGVEKDYKKAEEWHNKAVNQEVYNFKWRLFLCKLCLGFKKIIYWGTNKQIVKENIKSQSSSNDKLRNNIKTPEEYKFAAKQGNSESQLKLGICYYYGLGIGTNYNKAAQWYKKSAEQDNSEGQWRLGLCYEKGHGVKKDYIEAIKWYKKSAKQGNSEGQWRLGMCYENGRGIGKDYNYAVNWYKKSAKQGNHEGQWRLGMCYENGFGVIRDHYEAEKWFKKSGKTEK